MLISLILINYSDALETFEISIDISNECRNIRIADNGSGIHPDDIVLVTGGLYFAGLVKRELSK